MRHIEAAKATRKAPRQADPSVATHKEQRHSFHPQQDLTNSISKLESESITS